LQYLAINRNVPFFGGGGIPGQNHPGTKSNSDGTGLSFSDGYAIFWQYSDPRVGNIMQEITRTRLSEARCD